MIPSSETIIKMLAPRAFASLVSRIPNAQNKFHRWRAEMRHHDDHPFRRVVAVHQRRGVFRKPAFPPAPPQRGEAGKRGSFTTFQIGSIWRGVHEHSPSRDDPIRRVRCCSRRPTSACRSGALRPTPYGQEECAVVPDSILSGFPTVSGESFSPCPDSVPAGFVEPLRRQARRMPRAREHLPQPL